MNHFFKEVLRFVGNYSIFEKYLSVNSESLWFLFNFPHEQIEDHFGGIRTLSEGRGFQLLVGTTRNCILVGDVEMGFNPAMLGHTEEVWGLASHPTLPQFATAGHDRLLQMWDSLSHTVVWSKDIAVNETQIIKNKE